MIPGIGKYITDFLDGVIAIIFGAIGSIIGGIVDFITHPVESIETIISFFRGCPSVRAAEMSPLQIIAHHGVPFELPENTIQSCSRAIDLGATALEVDICMTSDELLILWHDWDPDSSISLARQTGAAGSDNAFRPDVPAIGSEWRKPTIDLTIEQFRQHFTYSDERDPVDKIKYEIEHGKADLSIPTLDEFMDAARRWESLRIVYLDIKMPSTSGLRYAGPMADKIHMLISDQLRSSFKVIVMVPDSLVLQVMKARAEENDYALLFTWDVEFPPGIILNPSKYSAIDHATSSLFHNRVASVGKPTELTLLSWRIYRRTIEYDIEQWNKVNADPARLNAGVKIDSLVAWTINDADEMKCLARMGVSGIITDKIKDLVDVAAAAGR
jgi:glycerophosphoryl diester phosphodiesterase